MQWAYAMMMLAARIALGLDKGLDSLVVVGAHGDLRHVDVAVAHGDGAQVLLGHRLAGGRELGHRPDRRGLGALPAGVGIHLRVQHHHVDVAPLRQHVVQPAVADVVRPAVAANGPDALSHQHIGHAQEQFGPRSGKARQLAFERRDAGALLCNALLGGLVGPEDRRHQVRAERVLESLPAVRGRTASACRWSGGTRN